MRLSKILLMTLPGAVYTLSVYAHSGIHERIEAVNQQIIEQDNNSEAYVRRAYLMAEHNEWQKVFLDLDLAARYSGNPDQIAFYRAFLLREWSRFNGDKTLLKSALQQVNRFLMIEPAHSDALLLRARLLRSLGHTEQALADYKRVITLTDKPQASLFIEQTELLEIMGRRDEAIAVLEQSIKQPDIAVLAIILTALKLEEARNKPESALVWFERLPSKLKRLPNKLMYKGDLLRKAGHKKQAHQSYCEALKIFAGFSSFRRQQPAFAELDVKLSERIKLPCD